MLSVTTKNVVLGNIQLLNYCKSQKIDVTKLYGCNIEKMGNKYFFVLPKKDVPSTMEHDIDSQPNVVLTMDASSEDFDFETTEWTEQIVQ